MSFFANLNGKYKDQSPSHLRSGRPYRDTSPSPPISVETSSSPEIDTPQPSPLGEFESPQKRGMSTEEKLQEAEARLEEARHRLADKEGRAQQIGTAIGEQFALSRQRATHEERVKRRS